MKLTLVRRVENDDGNSVTILPKKGTAVIEIGTECAVVSISFTRPNDLRALAGHLSAVADEVQRYQQGAGNG